MASFQEVIVSCGRSDNLHLEVIITNKPYLNGFLISTNPPFFDDPTDFFVVVNYRVFTSTVDTIYIATLSKLLHNIYLICQIRVVKI